MSVPSSMEYRMPFSSTQHQHSGTLYGSLINDDSVIIPYSGHPATSITQDPVMNTCGLRGLDQQTAMILPSKHEPSIYPRLRGGALKAWKPDPDSPSNKSKQTINSTLWYFAGGRGKPPSREQFEQRRLRAIDQGVTHKFWTSKGDIRGHKEAILWWWKPKKKEPPDRAQPAEAEDQDALQAAPADPAPYFVQGNNMRQDDDDHGRGAYVTPARYSRDTHQPSASVLASGAERKGNQRQGRVKPPPTQPPKVHGQSTSRPSGSDTRGMGGLGPNGGEDLSGISEYDQRHPAKPGGRSSTSTAFSGQGQRLGGTTNEKKRVSAHDTKSVKKIDEKQFSSGPTTSLAPSESAKKQPVKPNQVSPLRSGADRGKKPAVHGAAEHCVYGR